MQRLLEADWSRTADVLVEWTEEDDPLVVRAAVAAAAEPSLLGDEMRSRFALDLQRRAVTSYGAVPPERRRVDGVRVLRQALGSTIGVAVAATGDFTILEELAASDDPDLHWIVRRNLEKARLRPWPDHVERIGALLG